MAIVAAGISAAASIFGSKSSAKAARSAADAQREAAALQTLVARELHQHWKDYYRQCDIAAIQEVCAEPKYTPAYDAVMGRARAEVLRQFGRARAQVNRSQNIYCVGEFAQQCNFIAGIEALALVDQTNFGYRREETKKIQLDQVRLENLFRWLGLGRNLLSQSNAAALAASAAASKMGAQAGSGAGGWMELAGFLMSKPGQKLVGDIGSALGRLFGARGPTMSQQADAFGNFDMGYGVSGTMLPAGLPGGSGGAGQMTNMGFSGSDVSPPPDQSFATGQQGSLNLSNYGEAF